MLALITFPSTHDALRAEKLLLKRGMDVTLIPVPRGIASDCGLALRFDSDLLSLILPSIDGQVLIGKHFVKDGETWREIGITERLTTR